MTITVHNIDQEEAWATRRQPTEAGWHTVQIEKAIESESTQNNSQYEMDFGNDDYVIRFDRLTVVPQTYGKVLQFLNAIGVEPQPGDWDLPEAETLIGKRLSVRVEMEPDQDNPDKFWPRVRAYDKPGKGHGGKATFRSRAEVPGDTNGLDGGGDFGDPGRPDDDIPF